MITSYYSRYQAKELSQSMFNQNRIVSNEEIISIMGKFIDSILWIGYGMFVKRRIMTQVLGYEPFRRLRWDVGLPPLKKWLNDEVMNTFIEVLDFRETSKLSNDSQ